MGGNAGAGDRWDASAGHAPAEARSLNLAFLSTYLRYLLSQRNKAVSDLHFHQKTPPVSAFAVERSQQLRNSATPYKARPQFLAAAQHSADSRQENKQLYIRFHVNGIAHRTARKVDLLRYKRGSERRRWKYISTNVKNL